MLGFFKDAGGNQYFNQIMTLIMSKTAGKHVRQSVNQDKNPNPVYPAKYLDLGAQYFTWSSKQQIQIWF